MIEQNKILDILKNKIDYLALKKEAKKNKSVVWLDNILNSRTRLVVSNIFMSMSLLFFILILKEIEILKYFVSFGDLSEADIKNKKSLVDIFLNYINKDGFYFALFSLSFSIFLILKSFRAYLFSNIFSDKRISFDLSKIVLKKSFFGRNDMFRHFFESNFGKEVTKRLLMDNKKIKFFLKEKKDFVFDDNFIFSKNKIEKNRVVKEINSSDYINAIYDNDEEFSRFLLKNSVTKKDIVNATSWVSKKHFDYKNKKRWWSRRNLASIGKIGTSLSFGQTFTIDKYAVKLIEKKTIFKKIPFENYKKDVEKLERILIKDSRNNAFLISESAGMSLDLLKAFEIKVKIGESYSSLERSRVYILQSLMMMEATGNDFEKIFLKLLNEAAEAGNIILVLDDFYPFYEKAKAMGLDVLAIMKSYFDTNLSFVILSNKYIYESFLKNNTYLKEYFETILTYQDSTDGLLFLFQNKIFSLERRYKVFFSYRALKYLAESTKNFFPNDPILEKFMLLLEELIVFQKEKGKNNIGRKDTKKFIENKTGVTQVITKKVREKLLNIEKELHRRVIGQESAIESIADAIRRSRSGINDSKKPIATFLFIGSTGVGKTETAKALAESYFGNEDSMIRFDMSEYSTSESVANFLGSTYTNKVGALSKAMSQAKQSLVLFDEMEKASREIHDLFLQILDEGKVKDVFGEKIFFRNSIIIATSNAGSELIYKNDLKDLSDDDKRKKIVDYIVENKIFRPEFLNRFDKIILFKKFKDDEFKKIINLQLKSLGKRLLKGSYIFEPSESLINYIADKSKDTLFGARETNRMIKAEIESVISKEIIKQNITNGDKFTIIYDEENKILKTLLI